MRARRSTPASGCAPLNSCWSSWRRGSSPASCRTRKACARPGAAMSPPAASPLLSGDCRVRFGGERAEVETGRGAPALRVALPVLAGAAEEQLLAAAAAAEERAGYRLFQRGNSLAGFAVAAPEPDLETATLELYRRLFAVTAGRHLYRICNYVPQINAHSQGLENYRHFCRGRSLAFEATFGAQFQRRLPPPSRSARRPARSPSVSSPVRPRRGISKTLGRCPPSSTPNSTGHGRRAFRAPRRWRGMGPGGGNPDPDHVVDHPADRYRHLLDLLLRKHSASVSREPSAIGSRSPCGFPPPRAPPEHACSTYEPRSGRCSRHSCARTECTSF